MSDELSINLQGGYIKNIRKNIINIGFNFNQNGCPGISFKNSKIILT